MIRFLIIISIFLFQFLHSFATRVQGHVKDKDNNPVSYCIVKGDSTRFEALANEYGYYELDLVPGRYTLIAEMAGFKSQSKPVMVGDDTMTVDFTLDEQEFTLETVVVTNAEDPAYGIMRYVLDHKKKRKLLIRSLETDIYLKGVLALDGVPEQMLGKKISDTAKSEMGVDSLGRGIVYLLEQQSRYSYYKPDKHKTEVISVKQSGDPQGLGFATLPPVIDFYENVVSVINDVNERGFISPLHDNAFYYYKYKLIGSYDDHGNNIYKIEIKPKRIHEPCFSGFIYIVDQDYELKAVDLIATKNQGVNILDSMSYRQSYKMITNTRNWIVENQMIVPFLSFFGFKITGSFLTSYTNQKLNEYIDPKIFEGKIISTYSKDAWEKKSDYWDSVRSVPLTEMEQKSIQHIDSMAMTYKARSDSAQNQLRPLLGVEDLFISGPGLTKGGFTFRINDLLDIYNFNSVEGHNITLKPILEYKPNAQNTLSGTYHGRYGFSSEQYFQRGAISYQHSIRSRPDRSHKFRISGGHYIQEYTGLWNVSEMFNTWMTLIYGQNLLHFYERKYLSGQYDYDLGNGLKLGASLLNEERWPLENNTDFTWANKKSSKIQPNHPSTIFPFVNHKASILQLRVHYQPGWRYIDYPTYRKGISNDNADYYFYYTKGIPKLLGSDVNFDKWSIGVEHKKSMGLLGRLDYHLNAGGFLNKKYVGIPDLHHFKSSEIFLENSYLQSFQMAPYFRLSNDAQLYGRMHLEWHLLGLLTNKIPYFNKLDWNLVLATNSIFINKNDYYNEISLGFENIGYKMFRFMRVNCIMSMDSKYKQGEPRFGVRVGIDSKILSNAANAFD